MKYLITGGCGFLGSNLASEVLKKGENLVVFDNLSRLGAYNNLEWLKSLGNFEFVHGDIRNQNDVENVIKRISPDVIFHLAGQVAMTTSIDDPRKDFEINVLGSFNVLESVRKFSPNSVIVYSSTNKVYGDLEQFNYLEKETRYELEEFPLGLSENVNLNFSSPYGCSKGAADQYMLDYNRIFGLKTVVLRHSSMYGGRQFSTYDQGWVGWFCEQAVRFKNGDMTPFTISGSGKQVRDVLHADDMISLYFSIVKNIDKISGQAFNIGGGIKYSLSLLELFALLEDELKVKLNFTKLPPRESDQKFFVADISKINKMTGWEPKVDPESGLKRMISWINDKNK